MTDTQTTDPLGREITLHERTWISHIVKGHPEVAGHRDLVEAAIRWPKRIVHSKSDSDCRLYYGQGPRDGIIISVVVDVSLGLVKTAHLAKKTTGGAIEWSPPTP